MNLRIFDKRSMKDTTMVRRSFLVVSKKRTRKVRDKNEVVEEVKFNSGLELLKTYLLLQWLLLLV